MNRKLTFLIVAVVATILPAIAVADVMVTGTVGFTGTANNMPFYFTEGSNFETADGSISWNSYSHAGGSMGDLEFGVVSNQTTFIVDVMEIAFAQGTPAGTFTLGSIVSSPFPSGSVMYLSLSPMSFSDFSYSGAPGAVPSAISPSIHSFPLDTPQVYSMPVNADSIIYIGFFTPSYNGVVSGELALFGSYVAG